MSDCLIFDLMTWAKPHLVHQWLSRETSTLFSSTSQQSMDIREACIHTTSGDIPLLPLQTPCCSVFNVGSNNPWDNDILPISLPGQITLESSDPHPIMPADELDDSSSYHSDDSTALTYSGSNSPTTITPNKDLRPSSSPFMPIELIPCGRPRVPGIDPFEDISCPGFFLDDPPSDVRDLTSKWEDTAGGATGPPPAEISVFENKWAKVQKSPLGGLGLFATRYIPKDTAILVERPLLRFSTTCPWTTAIRNLEVDDLDILYSLSCFNFSASANVTAGIINCNAFDISTEDSEQTESAILPVASRINHSCSSLLDYSWNHEWAVMIFTANKDIEAGTELTICYTLSGRKLWATYGFECGCGSCPAPVTEQDKADFRAGFAPKL